jgi:hypothetical protein
MKTMVQIKTVLSSSAWRGLLFLLVLLLIAYVALAPFFPHRVTPASASAEQFSAERAMAYLTVIASEPHPQGSPAQKQLRDYLVAELTELGLEVEVQQTRGLENVVARLHGSDPTGAIVILAHYDSVPSSPGAADNGAGTAALLEIMHALAAGPIPRNDIIALFDDGEEPPDALSGTKAFVREHPWMADVRVAIGMDTASRGYICTDDTGSENGWMVQVLASAYTGGAWYSMSGGGNYDTRPFRDAGIQVLELEDNYPFHEQHTPDDVPSTVKPGTLQQLGEQALAVARVLGDQDLNITKGEQRAYASVAFVGFVHYPEDWSLPLAVVGGVLFVVAFVLTLWRKIAFWRGLALALLTILIMGGLSFFAANALWQAAPRLFGWETHRWSEWPEVIPPHGWLIFLLSNLLFLALTALAYRLVRRWSARADFSMVVLFIFFLVLPVLAIALPKATPEALLPLLLGSAGWTAAALLRRDQSDWPLDLGCMLTAVGCIIAFLPLFPGVFMGDGTKSVAILAALLPLLLGAVLPAIDGLLVRPLALK